MLFRSRALINSTEMGAVESALCLDVQSPVERLGITLPPVGHHQLLNAVTINHSSMVTSCEQLSFLGRGPRKPYGEPGTPKGHSSGKLWEARRAGSVTFQHNALKKSGAIFIIIKEKALAIFENLNNGAENLQRGLLPIVTH